jgi:hypothetical protein
MPILLVVRVPEIRLLLERTKFGDNLAEALNIHGNS